MDEPKVVDKQLYKVMCYIYKHKEVEISKVIAAVKGKVDEADVRIMTLCDYKFAAYRAPGSRTPTFDTCNFDHSGKVGLTPLGLKYVEDRRESLIKWLVPMSFSLVSVVFALISLLVSLFGNSELFVHLIK